MPRMSAVDVKKLQAIIDSTDPILTRLQEAEALLTPQGLMWVTVVNCDLILVHLCNRAGLGVNQHEVHRLGFRVRKVGFHSLWILWFGTPVVFWGIYKMFLLDLNVWGIFGLN